MYTSAATVDELIRLAFDPGLMQDVVDLAGQALACEGRLFDNGRTFSAVAYGENPLPSPGYENAGLVNITAQKNYIALYIYDFSSGNDCMAQYADVIPKTARGKGCIRIRNADFLGKYREAIAAILAGYRDSV